MVTLQMPKNSQEAKVKGPEMNDRDRVNDLLATLKYMSAGFNTGLNEMQNPKNREVVNRILNDLHDMQDNVFDAMFQNGWYKMKVADEQEVSQAHKQFSNYRTQFPSF